MGFDPKAHMRKLKGQDYLEVKWRLVWFREDHPDYGIETLIHTFDSRTAVVQARITDANGRVVAMGTKQEQPEHFSDYLEKAETGAIGRALAALGYGTQFAPELDEGDRIVDSPVDSKPAPSTKPAPVKPSPPPPAPKAENLSDSIHQPAAPKPNLPSLPAKVITEPQVKRLWVIAHERNWKDEQTAEIIKAAGFTSSKEITADKYEAIIKVLETDLPPVVTANAG